MESDNQESSFIEDLSEDEADWEEVAVPHSETDSNKALAVSLYDPYADAAPPEPSSSKPRANIEITLGVKKGEDATKPKGISHAERLMRIDCHKTHTICLLASARVRNKWLNDELLHARLMSLAPLSLQNSFAMITKARVPDAGKRGRLFETALQRLVDWWIEFFEVIPEGHLRNRTFDEVATDLVKKARERERLAAAKASSRKGKGKGKGKQRAQEDDEVEGTDGDGEVLRSEKSLMKLALMQYGSRDVSAQLFTALCRALGLPARLVVSIQSVPWQTGVGKPKPPTRKKKKDKDAKETKSGTVSAAENLPRERTPETNIKGKGKAVKNSFPGGGQRLSGATDPIPTPATSSPPRVIKLRKSKTTGQTLGSSDIAPIRVLQAPDPLTTPPVFWTEVFSRPDGRWIPVDPIRGHVNKRKAFDPAQKPQTGPGPRFRQENRLVYVVGLEDDGYGRDVTPRYAKEYGAKVAKLQGAERAGSKGRKEWWERVCNMIRRPYRLHRDDVEDDELQDHQLTEAMPTTISGFKDHPLYALERHLKRDEIIHPMKDIGKFRGEPVFPRANVLPLKSAENWMRSGRKVREGCQAMKQVKQHAATLNRQREIEMAKADGGTGAEGVMQGMYALNQTELYRPPPVVNGKIPKNDFNNIDLYVPSMLPAGAVHLPYKGIAKIARKLGFDYAEAVTGFEFRKRKATPVLTGIVVAAENETTVLEAYWEEEQDAAEKERKKRYERVMKRWIRLVQGLRIRQRLQAQYAGKIPEETVVTVNVEGEPPAGGGFLVGADDVVQPFSLPRYQHLQLDTTAGPSTSVYAPEISPSKSVGSDLAYDTRHLALDVVGDDDDEDMEEAMAPVGEDLDAIDPSLRVPKTMLELAAASAKPHDGPGTSESDLEEIEVESGTPKPPARRPARKTTSRKPTGASKTPTRSSARVQSTPVRPTPSGSTGTRRSTRKRAREEDDDELQSSESHAEAEASTSRRPTRAQKAVVVPSTIEKRVLRPRKPKPTTQYVDQDEMDDGDEEDE